ncbi:sugar ABC transporter permease [Arthrobacter sp. AZCC_0090]|uniref:ABC transporter permease n=1 Tax=Arthrobacter sp. AZCC_0090 TaxID=2735881 RepID=UPI0017C92907|nr:sugar ABC transporter permease [Arthrobacter sp. AZCC_0090]MBB6404510.1 ABC-type spermidine/putrescine transport system permease subunit I [Arthrobacter sp. AZCC_0090]
MTTTLHKPAELQQTVPPAPVGRPKRLGQRAVGFFMALPPILLIALFVGFPIVLAFGFSIGLTGGLNHTIATIGQNVHEADAWWGTLAAYQEMFTNKRFLGDLLVTVIVTLVSTATVIFLALGIGLYLKLKGGRMARVLSGLAIVPLFIPVVIASWAILTFYSGTGFLRSVFALAGLDFPVWAFTMVTVIIGSVWTSLPFAVLMVSSGLQSVPNAMIEAARDAGAGALRTIVSVIVPMAAVPIIIATTFTAIGIVGSFTVPYFTGPNSPNMLGVDMSNYFSSFNQPQQSAVMAFTVFLIASGIAALYVWANFRSAKEQGKV